MSENLLSALTTFGLSSNQTKELFLEHSTIKKYNKNDILVSTEERNDKEYFLIEGVLHRFNNDERGDIITTGFYLGSTVVTPHFARTIRGKSLFSLQALTDVHLAVIPVSTLDNLRHTHKAFLLFGQKVIDEELSKNMLVDIAYRSSSAKERLLLLRKMYPNLENLIPHNIIASYLGITNVSFSRLRGELAKK